MGRRAIAISDEFLERTPLVIAVSMVQVQTFPKNAILFGSATRLALILTSQVTTLTAGTSLKVRNTCLISVRFVDDALEAHWVGEAASLIPEHQLESSLRCVLNVVKDGEVSRIAAKRRRHLVRDEH